MCEKTSDTILRWKEKDPDRTLLFYTYFRPGYVCMPAIWMRPQRFKIWVTKVFFFYIRSRICPCQTNCWLSVVFSHIYSCLKNPSVNKYLGQIFLLYNTSVRNNKNTVLLSTGNLLELQFKWNIRTCATLLRMNTVNTIIPLTCYR